MTKSRGIPFEPGFLVLDFSSDSRGKVQNKEARLEGNSPGLSPNPRAVVQAYLHLTTLLAYVALHYSTAPLLPHLTTSRTSRYGVYPFFLFFPFFFPSSKDEKEEARSKKKRKKNKDPEEGVRFAG